MRIPIIALICLGTIATCCAQVIPAERTTTWGMAGLSAPSLEPVLTLNIIDLGGSGDGVTPNDAALASAFVAAQGQMTAIFFPAGDYLFNNYIDMPDSVVLRGAGSENTTLTFALGGSQHCIAVVGAQLTQHYPLTEDALRGTTHLALASTEGLLPGGTIRLYRNDTALVESWWAEGSAGQIAHIASVAPDGVELTGPLRADFTVEGSAYFVPLRPARSCGIECLKVLRTDATAGQYSNIWLYLAEECWVRGVESQNCNFAHVELYTSTNCEVSGCWMHHAFNYGSGGQGYGVLAYLTSGENLIVNNIFQHVRHAMLIEAGANGNVFAYNHSIDPYWNEGLFPTNSAGDIVLHGDYPYLNLFEGNIVQNIVVDDSHGKNGPFNTLFRNRADLWGLLMNNGPASDSLNIVGNDVTHAPPQGLWVIHGNGHLLYGDLVQGAETPAGTGDLMETSYYAASEPLFLQNTGGWPQTGPNHVAPGTIPAAQRYAAGTGLTVCTDEISTVVDHRAASTMLRLYPSPFEEDLLIDGLENMESPLRVRISDMSGRLVQDAGPVDVAAARIELNTTGLKPGAYVLRVVDRQGRSQQAVAVKR